MIYGWLLVVLLNIFESFLDQTDNKRRFIADWTHLSHRIFKVVPVGNSLTISKFMLCIIMWCWIQGHKGCKIKI